MFPKTQSYIKQLVAAQSLPGVSYAFIQGDQRETQTYGYAQLIPTKEKLTDQLLFDVASLTKVICTTSLILKLVEQEKIKIDDSLVMHLPEFADDKVTLRHLLTHTSDLNPYIKNRDQLSAVELKAALLKLQSGEARGEKVTYTDTGMLLLGFLIEKFYGKPVQYVFQTEVLEPLEMEHSGFPPLAPAQCVATENQPVRGLIRGEVHDPKAHTLGAHCGSAGLFTNVADLLPFVQMYLNKGKTESGELFLQEATIQTLLQDWTPTKAHARSLGWDLKSELKDQTPLLFHTGYTGTFLLIDIANQEAFIFLSNRVHPVDHREAYLKERDQLIEIFLKEKMR